MPWARPDAGSTVPAIFEMSRLPTAVSTLPEPGSIAVSSGSSTWRPGAVHATGAVAPAGMMNENFVPAGTGRSWYLPLPSVSDPPVIWPS